MEGAGKRNRDNVYIFNSPVQSNAEQKQQQLSETHLEGRKAYWEGDRHCQVRPVTSPSGHCCPVPPKH